jgi:hypothetical protein
MNFGFESSVLNGGQVPRMRSGAVLPASGINNEIFIDTGANTMYFYNGAWVSVGAPAGTITGGGTANYLPKFTGAATIGNSVVYENGGKIALGGTSAPRLLSVYETIQTQGYYVTLGGVDRGIFAADGSNNSLIGSISANDFLLFSNNTERARIFSGGNVTIGSTVDSGQKLGVQGAIVTQQYYQGNIIGTPFSTWYYSGGTAFFGSNSAGVNLTLMTDAGTRRMTLFTGGNVAIGTTTDSGFKLNVAGTINNNNNLTVTSGTAYIGIGNNGQQFKLQAATTGEISRKGGFQYYHTWYMQNNVNADVKRLQLEHITGGTGAEKGLAEFINGTNIFINADTTAGSSYYNYLSIYAAATGGLRNELRGALFCPMSAADMAILGTVCPVGTLVFETGSKRYHCWDGGVWHQM